MYLPDISISEPDYARIKRLLAYYQNPELENELDRADIINCILVPPTLVTLDTRVTYIDHNEKVVKTSLLVLPHCPEDQDEVISVLSSTGTALIGLEEGDRISWKIKDKEKTLEVVDIIYQPEASGNLHPLTFHNEFNQMSL